MQDNLDTEIIEKLSKNGRISLTDLSEGMELSRVAVANRIEKLIQNDLLKVSLISPQFPIIHQAYTCL